LSILHICVSRLGSGLGLLFLLAKPAGINFTNMRNEAVYDVDDDPDSDDDSDDSDYESDDDPSDSEDDDSDDLIEGVNMRNEDQPDPPDGNVDENQQTDDEEEDEEHDTDVDEDDSVESAPEEQAETENPVLSAPLKKLATNGKLHPILESRTRQKTPNTSEALVTGTVEAGDDLVQPMSKKQRKRKRELQKQMLKRDEEEKKQRLKNKAKNERRRAKIKANEQTLKETKNEPDAGKTEQKPGVSFTKNELDAPKAFGDRRDQLKAEQKPGVSFPHDSCSAKSLTPELEAIALTQYNLKRGLKEYGNDGLDALGKEVEQL
jgi:hypothetical protein